MTMRVGVVGAGVAGLVAARELDAHGVEVVVFDKGRSPGGRLATRRVGGATLDHGAQFFTARTPAFAARVDDWQRRGLVRIWNHGFDGDDGHPRYVGTAGMNALAKDLAVGLDVRCSTMVFALRATSDGITIVIDDGTEHAVDAAVMTAPLPQAMAMLLDGGIELHEFLRTGYDRTIGLLARLDRPAALPVSGAVQDADEIFSFIGDNASKGISAEPAVTFHANPAWSEEHWELADDELVDRLSRAAAPWLGEATMLETSLKKWRLATPRAVFPDPCWATADGRVVLAGDAFAGPKVEGAHNSGLAAAHRLLD